MRKMRNGFTLVELLVIIAILAIFTGLVLPALNSALNSGRSMGCINNLKGQGQSLSMYLNDYNGNWTSPWLMLPTGIVRWYHVVRFYSGEQPSLSTGSQHMGLVRCATDDTKGPTGYVHPNYAINGRTYDRAYNPAGLDLRRVFGLKYPSRTLMTIDGKPNYKCTSGNENYVVGLFINGGLESPAGRTIDILIANYMRHGEGVNHLYCDGHADTMNILRFNDEINTVGWFNSVFFDYYQRF